MRTAQSLRLNQPVHFLTVSSRKIITVESYILITSSASDILLRIFMHHPMKYSNYLVITIPNIDE